MTYHILVRTLTYALLSLIGMTACSDDPEQDLIDGNILPSQEYSDQGTIHLKLTIPDVIYVTVGTELNLWNDAVSLSVDKGLASPLNYQIKWNCDKGIITDRCFRFKPNISDLGEYNCSCNMYDLGYKQIDTKDFIIKVLPNDQNKQKINCVYFGDSLGPSTVKELIANFNNATKFKGVKPTFLGTKKEKDNHHEAVGGYTFLDYATKGRTSYRVKVAGIQSLEPNAIYTIGDKNYTLIEVNTTNGSGNILLLNQNESTGHNFPQSGSLKKVSGAGDPVISYTDGFEESNNPLWNMKKGKIDIETYKTKIGLSSNEKIDIVSFQFGINDAYLANNTDKLKEYISDLYKAFITDNPNCRFILGMTPSAGNDVNGAGANYGAAFDWITYLKQTYTLRKSYLTLDKKEFPNLLIAPVHLGLDRYYGYGFSERVVSDRNNTNELYHHNYVHPCESGYQQIADIYLGTYVAAMMGK